MRAKFNEQMERVLEKKGWTRAQLARALGVSAPAVTQALRKESNLTLRTMANFAAACDYELHVVLRKRTARSR